MRKHLTSRIVAAALAALMIPAIGLTAAHAAEKNPDPPTSGDLFYDDFQDGMAGWTAMSASLDDWTPGTDDFAYVTVDNLDAGSGYYVRPTADLTLPENYQVDTVMRVDATTSGSSISVITDMLEPYSYVANNVATQIRAFTAADQGKILMAKPNSKKTICQGAAPYTQGEWFHLTVRRTGGVTAVWIDGELVASITPDQAGGTIALGVYKATVSFGPIAVNALSSVPADQPATAEGCTWQPPSEPLPDQPVITNQSGFNLDEPKRFTAPKANDGDPFVIKDTDGDVRYSGAVRDHVGDFSDFNPSDTGPFTITVTGEAGEGTSYDFGIGANWIERVSYARAVQFMTDVRCFYGDMSKMTFGGHDSECLNGVGWRDSHQMSFEVPTLIDMYLANPTVFTNITDPGADYIGMRYELPADTPEVVRLIAWGIETYLKGQINHTLLKEQLAAFLYAYPQLSDYIPVALYDDARDYLFGIWGDEQKDRYTWYDYTPHTANLFQTYTQIGTGKGEFPVGHSVAPNIEMYVVAQREGRDDAQRYLNAAVNQAAWIVDNIDVTDPRVTKGQRQGGYHLMAGLAKLAAVAPEAAPAGLHDFVQRWADTVIERSDNMWDFHKYSDDRWTIPNFAGGGSGDDPNETGNILGFPAAALAAVRVLGEGPTSDRLREIAVGQVDDIFGRNPVARMASYRGPTEQWGFEGVDQGWFSEYQGGAGRLQGARGVFDGSPKNALYPYNPEAGNPGHSEGWVTFNTAWNETLAWRAFDKTRLTVSGNGVSAGSEGLAVAPGSDVGITLEAPLNMDVTGGNTGQVQVSVDGDAQTPVTVEQTEPNSLVYAAALDLDALGAVPGDRVTLSYGLGYFTRSTSFTVAEEVPVTPGDGDDSEDQGAPGDHSNAGDSGRGSDVSDRGSLVSTGSMTDGVLPVALLLLVLGAAALFAGRRRARC